MTPPSRTVVDPAGPSYSEAVDDLRPAPSRRARRGLPLAVTAAGALLVFCAVLPWAGLRATSGLVGGLLTGMTSALTSEVRGVDDVYGVCTLIAGLAAVACGVAGLRGRPRLAALAVLPGGAAVLLVVLFVTEGSRRDRISIRLGDLLAIEPVIAFGWFAALASAVTVTVLAVLALLRRG
ncbi:hypothetical protein SAMN05421874_101493 [Nonomuraea maritima]|uniref:Uncharacterized protein n=1 Tax=Nonomuraea maritima TaxID=683260 RepID=A0A1G8SZV3_9ACTN|nr:hypothetical protein SAMN05421874_101493 [Nonomuraea maritima]